MVFEEYGYHHEVGLAEIINICYIPRILRICINIGVHKRELPISPLFL